MEISFSFTFSKKTKIEDLAIDLSNVINQRVQIINSNTYYITEDKTHPNSFEFNSIVGTEEKMYAILINLMIWLSNNATTSKYHNLKINYHDRFTNLNSTALRLIIDEKKIYEYFPLINPNAKSVKNIKMTDFDYRKNMSPNLFLGMVSSLYSNKFGIDFTQLPNTITFKYIYGPYLTDLTKIMRTIDIYKQSIKDVLEMNLDNISNNVLGKAYDKQGRIMDSFNSYKVFEKKFPKIKLLVDLKDWDKYVDVFYPTIRSTIMTIIASIKTNEEYFINYDSTEGKYQIKDLKGILETNNINLNLDIIDSNLFMSDFVNCSVYTSNIEKSYLNNCDCISITGSNNEFEKTYLDRNCEITDSFIINRSLVNGKITNSIIRDSYLGPTLQLSEDTQGFNNSKLESGHLVINGKRIINSKNKW